MFTENELRRIKSFLKEYRNLNRVASNLRNRLWYGTHGTGSPTKEAQIANRYRKLLLSQKSVYNKSVEYANALKRKYGLRIRTAARPNLTNLQKAMRTATRRQIVEKVMRTTPLVPNMLRELSRTAYRSPPRARKFNFGRRNLNLGTHEPW